MPQVSTALMSLLPLAGAVALTVQGLRRLARPRDAAASRPVPQPIEPPAPPLRPRRQSAADGTCTGCGTSVPARASLCATCERKAAGQENSTATTLLHWLVFIAAMSAVIGTGWLLSP